MSHLRPTLREEKIALYHLMSKFQGVSDGFSVFFQNLLSLYMRASSEDHNARVLLSKVRSYVHGEN